MTTELDIYPPKNNEMWSITDNCGSVELAPEIGKVYYCKCPWDKSQSCFGRVVEIIKCDDGEYIYNIRKHPFGWDMKRDIFFTFYKKPV